MEEYTMIDKDNNEFDNSRIEDFKKPSVLQVGLLFSFVVIIFLYLGSKVQRWNVNYGVLITEFGLILIPPIAFLLIFKFDVKKVLRLNNPGFLNLFIIFWIMVFSLPVIGVLNILNFWVIREIFGKYEVFQAPISTGPWGLLIGIVVIGVSAGICEETLFRGVIQRGFERFGAIKSIFITAALFGLMHMDFQRFLGTFVLGALLGFLTYKSNSIVCSIFAHFANNSIAVCLTYISLKATEMMKKSGAKGVENIQNGDIFAAFKEMSQIELTVAIVFYTIMFTISAIGLYALIRAFIWNNRKREVAPIKDEKRTPLFHLVGFMPGLVIIGFVYVMDFLRMSGLLEQTVIEQIMRGIGL